MKGSLLKNDDIHFKNGNKKRNQTKNGCHLSSTYSVSGSMLRSLHNLIILMRRKYSIFMLTLLENLSHR